MALAKTNRLSKEKDIKNVFSRGKTIKGGFFFIRFIKNGLSNSRIAVVVSKKVSKKATERNLIQRRIHESLEKKYLQKNGLDILIVTLPTILEKPFKEIKTEIDETTKILFGQTWKSHLQ